ncbi:MAG: histidinol-phosphate transaminase [Acidobacteriota bacterium]
MNGYIKALGIAATSAGKRALRLHLNENRGGCSPAVLQALQRLTTEDIASYPDYTAAIDAAAAYFGVPADWVMLVNGLDDAVRLLSEAAANRGALTPAGPGSFSGVILDPAFDMYAAGILGAGGRVSRVAPRENFVFSLDDVLAASEEARLIYLTDPNNPTGIGLPTGAVEALSAARPEATIFLDEAYADFSGRSFIPTLRSAPERFPNVIVGRTFSKAFGLAGLRVGVLIAPPATLAPIEALPSPFNVNAAAAVALPAALSDPAWMRSTVAEAAESRQAVYDYCDRVGLEYWRSEANFVLVRVAEDTASTTAIVEAFAARDILVRDRSSAPGCRGCIRITTGLLAHTARCLRALEEIRASRND